MKTRAAGFTLIEILTALLVLAIGLSAVVSLVFTARRVGNTSVDRNIAKTLITEAVADIERAHLITENMVAPGGAPILVPAGDVGLLLETVVGGTPSIHDATYGSAVIYGGVKSFQWRLSDYCGLKCFSPGLVATTTNTLLWPFGNDPKFAGGVFPQSNPGYDPKNDPQAAAYRVIYRLERHPKWINPNPVNDTSFQGLYVLTLVVYRDPDRQGSRLEQVTDPVVVYLRDKKDRN